MSGQRAHVLYLHGFGSGPTTEKGVDLGRRLADAVASYGIPALDGGDFPNLTMDGMLRRVHATAQGLPADGEPLVLVGSSLGGYLAALLAAEGLQRLAGVLLIAPAFGFTDDWQSKLGPAAVARWRSEGSLPFHHYAAGGEVPLKIGFLESCQHLPALPGQAHRGDRPLPVAIVHGRQDAVVDHRQSVAYATQRDGVELHLVDGDHRLTEARHGELIAWCARDLIRRSAE